MANYANLEAAIVAAVYENANNEITGAALQSVLLQMVSSMGKSGMLCNGVADGSTTPPVNPDSNIFYIAPTGTYPNFGGLVVADGEWAIFIYNGSWQKQSVPVVTADAVPTTGSTNPVQSGGVADALEQKADIDGYYSTLTAGSAENLIGRGTVPAEYTRRTSGGSADLGSGAAAIEKIHGNTIVWNQIVEAAKKTVNAPAGGNTVKTLSASAIIPQGHKIYVSCTQTACSSILRNTFYLLNTANNTQYENSAANYNLSAGRRSWLTTNNLSDLSYICLWTGGGDVDITYDNIQCFDLTLMFGAGNEPSTAAEFEALFPLNYYTPNNGSLVSLTGTGIETNGFNQWDEVWESGAIDASTGNNTPAAGYYRSTNYIPVFPNTEYYFQYASRYGTLYLRFYDAEKKYLGYNYLGKASIITPQAITLTGVSYVRFCWGNSLTYNNDICINLSWSGYRNGEYEAYWDSTLALPITTVTSGGSAVFADGMKGIGGVYDELTSSKAVKRIGQVNLGSLSWTRAGGGQFISGDLVGQILEPLYSNSPAANCVCSKYPTLNYAGYSAGDKCLMIMYSTFSNHGYIYIKDSSYSDAPTFKTAMNGVYMAYELKTYTEYTLDSEVNLNYRVDDFGTETLLPQNNATPTTAPIIYDVRYAMNAVDTLRNLPKNYISKDSMEHILTAMVTAGVISAYTLTWNTTNENYDCTITV